MSLFKKNVVATIAGNTHYHQNVQTAKQTELPSKFGSNVCLIMRKTTLCICFSISILQLCLCLSILLFAWIDAGVQKLSNILTVPKLLN